MPGYLFVHAHPDDEAITTGATMAHFAAAGEPVTLVTCTRGERGEVIPESLHALVGDAAALGAYRAGELTAAMIALQVSDHVFLGAETGQVFEDSGMAWGSAGVAVPAPDTGPAAFTNSSVEHVAELLADVICDRTPEVVVTYEPGGGYGHPDHVHAHRATMAAVHLAASRGHQVRSVWWTVTSQERTRARLRELAQQGYRVPDPDGPLGSGCVADATIDLTIDAARFLPAKRAAMAAHHTQIVVDTDAYSLSNAEYWPLTGVEHYQVVKP